MLSHRKNLYILKIKGCPGGTVIKKICLPVQEMQVQSLGWEDPLKKEMATHSSILAWEIPWTHGQRILASYSPWCHKRVGHD